VIVDIAVIHNFFTEAPNPGVGTLYVDAATGDDNRSRIEAANPLTPWASLGRACWGNANRDTPNAAEAAAAGDVVSVMAATYTTTGRTITGSGGARFNVAYNPINEGTVANPIVFAANGIVTLTYTANNGPVLGAQGKDNITWRGSFSVNGANCPPPTFGDSGLAVITGCVNCVLDGLILVGAGNLHLPGTNTAGVYFFETFDPIVRNCFISRIYNNHDPTNAACVFGYAFGRAIIEHNDLSDAGCGVSLKSPDASGGAFVDYQIVRFNRVHGCNIGLHVHNIGGPLTDANPVQIYQNTIRDGTQTWGDGTFAPFSAGVKYQAFSSDPAINCNHCWFVNNTVVRVTYALFLQGNMLDGAGHRLWNNLAVDCTSIFFFMAPVANMVDSRYDFQHNRAFNFSGSRFELDPEGIPVFYPTVASFQAAFPNYETDDPDGADDDPDFVDEAGNDFRLNPGSAALTGGVDMLNLRGGGTSAIIPCGAYVSAGQTETIGPE
jgi:hypothetical protein